MPPHLVLLIRILSGMVLALALLAIAGWTVGISALQRVLPHWPTTAPPSAAGFLLAATALACLTGDRGVGRYRLALVLALLVGLIGGANLCLHLAGWKSDVAIGGDSALMSPAGALGFLLVAGAFVFASPTRSIGVFQISVLAVALLSWLGLARYLYGGEPLAGQTEMSLVTAVCFQLLSIGIFCTRTDGGLMALLLSDSAGGTQARRLLLPTVLIPSLFAVFTAMGHHAGLFGIEAGLVLLASACALLTAAFVWGNATALHRADIERRKAGHRLEASFRKVKDLQTALDEHAIVAITDPDGRITYVNDKFCEISKYSREELLGQDHRIVNSGYHPKELFRNLWTTIAQGRVWRGEIRNRAKDGSIYWVDATIVPFLGENGKPREYVAIRADISARKRVELELSQLNAELEQRVKERTAELEAANKELEAFSYSISHDLRAPLRAVNGFAGILIEDFESELPPAARTHLERIRGSGQRMGRLIEDLLKFSRLSRQPLRRQPVDMAELLKRALHELEPERKGRNLDLRIGRLPSCSGDPDLLLQAWINLLSNAVKYSRNRNPAVIEIGCDDRNGEQIYYIRDNGAGFDMRHADRLFGVFQRLHPPNEFEGTGAGLAIVQRIIHRHGGRVWVEAEVDRGATFFLTIDSPGSL